MRKSASKPISTEFAAIFGRLRQIRERHAGDLVVADDSPTRYGLEGKTGPATIRAWGGKTKRPTIPVARAEVGKSYVSFHPMPIYGDATLLGRVSQHLKSHLQGKSCFNFTSTDEPQLNELERLTAEGIAAFRRAGFVT